MSCSEYGCASHAPCRACAAEAELERLRKLLPDLLADAWWCGARYVARAHDRRTERAAVQQDVAELVRRTEP